ncbi:hypothetical protein HCH_02242 [Hahella chejuensis KCTC 2396]|uniref:Uncharacterized protein n=1 Tax=Hahella chejuensis (strain KCTC 2396) TaxID=349521 RepID=Q2SJV6_HAHCH|nr:hypothetical protein HCH_02242 [Hahella chejuensis KCTC 2396]
MGVGLVSVSSIMSSQIKQLAAGSLRKYNAAVLSPGLNQFPENVSTITILIRF